MERNQLIRRCALALAKECPQYTGPINIRAESGGSDQLRETLSGIESGQPVALLLEREGHLIYVALELD